MIVMFYPSILCVSSVNGSVCLVCCVLVNCFSETIHNVWVWLLFCCCCSPSETYGRKWGDSNFQILTELPAPPQAAGVVGTF